MSSATELGIAFLESQPAAATRALDEVPAPAAAEFLGELETGLVATSLGLMQPARVAAILSHMQNTRTGELLVQLPAGVRGAVLRSMPQETIKSALAGLSRKDRAAVRRYLTFAPGTVGAWMEAPKATFRRSTTVNECLRALKSIKERPGYLIFVTDENERLHGSLAVDEILTAKSSEPLENISKRKIETLSPLSRLTSIISLPAWDTSLALPVVNRARKLMGVLSFDRVREGLRTDRTPNQAMPLDRLTWQMTEAYMVSLSGLLNLEKERTRSTRLPFEGTF